MSLRGAFFSRSEKKRRSNLLRIAGIFRRLLRVAKATLAMTPIPCSLTIESIFYQIIPLPVFRGADFRAGERFQDAFAEGIHRFGIAMSENDMFRTEAIDNFEQFFASCMGGKSEAFDAAADGNFA